MLMFVYGDINNVDKGFYISLFAVVNERKN